MENILEHITINKNSCIISFTNEKLTEDELNSLPIPRELKTKLQSSIINFEGIYYYKKMVTSKEMLNELIGSILATKIDLETVDYQIGICDGNLYALSPLFYDDNHTYHNVKEYFSKTVANQEQHLITSGITNLYIKQPTLSQLINNKLLANKVLKLTALDLKMDQADRNISNVMLRKCIKTGALDLTPIYDFANSYYEKLEYPASHTYNNPFIIVRKNKLSLNALKFKNPEIMPTVKKLIDTPIEDVLAEIEKEKHITIPEQTKSFYKEKDQKSTKVLQKI